MLHSSLNLYVLYSNVCVFKLLLHILLQTNKKKTRWNFANCMIIKLFISLRDAPFCSYADFFSLPTINSHKLYGFSFNKEIIICIQISKRVYFVNLILQNLTWITLKLWAIKSVVQPLYIWIFVVYVCFECLYCLGMRFSVL